MGSSLSHQSAVDTISHWRAEPTHRLIFDSGHRDVRRYFESLDRLRRSGANLRTLNADLISATTSRLLHEFSAVLLRHSDPHPPASTTDSSFAADSTAYLFRYEEYAAHDPPTDDAVSYLRNIAQRMTSNECVEAYKVVRKPFLQAQLKRLRFEELCLGLNAKRYIWDELRLKMELWAQVCKICVKILFEKEKNLCEQIFGDDSAKDESFVGTVDEFAITLFNFAENITLSNQHYSKMDNILNVYTSFLWVLPFANALFDCEKGKGIRHKCAEILCRIEEDVVRMLHDFEHAVLHEIPSRPVAADDTGAVHQSTVYAMDQLGVIVKNKDILEGLIKSAPSLDFGDAAVPREALGDITGRSFLEAHLILIIVVLQRNLEAKSRNYTNSSLGRLFVMNNFRYIVKRIDEHPSNDVRKMIGDSYSRKLDESLKLATDDYVALACGKLLVCFDDEGLYVTRCFKPRLSKSAVKRRAKEINSAYEEFRRCHSLWTVTDGRLREEVRVSLHDNLVPAYVNFIEKLRDSNGEMDVLLGNNIKYSVADLEGFIAESLFGNGEVIA